MNKRVTSIAALVLLAFLAWALVYGLGETLGPLMIAFALSYLLFPAIRWLERHGIKRHTAVIAVFLAGIIFIVTLSLLVIPGLIADARSFVKDLPHNIALAADKLVQLAQRFNVELDLSKEGILVFVRDHISAVSTDMVMNVFGVTKGIFSGLSQWLLALLNLFLIPLFFFYVIDDYEKISNECSTLVPDKFRPILGRYMEITNRVLSGYLRGQFIVAGLLGLLYGIGLSIVGLRFGFLIGLLSGLISIIPYAGLTIGFSVAIMMALANYSGISSLIGVVVVYVVVQVLEGFVITPKLVGDKVGLSAFATMLALIIGGNLFGLLGMLLAIPMAAIIKAVIADLKKLYLASDWVRTPVPATDHSGPAT